MENSQHWASHSLAKIKLDSLGVSEKHIADGLWITHQREWSRDSMNRARPWNVKI